MTDTLWIAGAAITATVPIVTPWVMLAILTIGVLLLVRVYHDDRRRAQRYARTLALIREASQQAAIATVRRPGKVVALARVNGKVYDGNDQLLTSLTSRIPAHCRALDTKAEVLVRLLERDGLTPEAFECAVNLRRHVGGLLDVLEGERS